MRQLDRTQFASIVTFRQLCLGLLAAFALLAALPAGRALAGEQIAQPGATTRQEIRYRLPEAGAVMLVWGVDGWQQPPTAMLPPGTVAQLAVAYTPMSRQADAFVAALEVPAGTTIDYAFQITRTAAGESVDVWDANGSPKQDFHTVARGDAVVEVRPTLGAAQLTALGAQPGSDWSALWSMGALALGAVVTLGGGHWLRRRIVWSQLAEWQRDYLGLILLVIGSRVALLGLGYVVYAVFNQPNQDEIDFSGSALRGTYTAFTRADASWYTELARSGYDERPFSLERKANWAFYPLWPLVQRLASMVVPDLALAGILVSTAFLLGAVLLLYALLRLDFSREVALLSALLVTLFPTSYFFSRPGPEALFLLLSVAALLCARRRRWLWAGLLGALAALTRLQGILLLAPLLMLYVQQRRRREVGTIAVLPLLLLPLALGGFMLYLWRITGNPLASFAIQRAWDNNVAYPFAAVLQFVASPQLVGYYGFDLALVSWGFVVGATALAVALLRDRRVPREYVVYALLSLYPIVARDTLTGSLRYLMVIFPLFLMLALWLQRRQVWSQIVLGSFVALHTMYYVAFVLQYNWAAN